MTKKSMDSESVKNLSSFFSEPAGTGKSPTSPENASMIQADPFAAANAAPVSGIVPSTVLMDVLASIQSVLPDVINSVSNIVGFLTEIYFPFGTSSVYGKNDNKIRYSTYPQIRRCFIGANLFAQADIGVFDGSEFTPYIGDSPYLMTFNFKIPENSKVKIYYGTSYRWMKVRSHQAQDGSGTYMVIFNMLSPCNSSGEIINDEPLPTEENPIVADPINAKGTVKAGQNLI